MMFVVGWAEKNIIKSFVCAGTKASVRGLYGVHASDVTMISILL